MTRGNRRGLNKRSIKQYASTAGQTMGGSMLAELARIATATKKADKDAKRGRKAL